MDIFPADKRHEIMSKIKSKNTRPELIVRSILHNLGFRFRLHKKELPGCPDVVLPKYRKVLFINGCFWHGHKNCKRASIPVTNYEFWEAKIKKNILRDRKNIRELKKQGWSVLVIWQCEIKNDDILIEKLRKFLQHGGR